MNTTAEKNMGKIKLHKGNSEQDIQQRRTELTEKKKVLKKISTDVEAEKTECEMKKTMQRYQMIKFFVDNQEENKQNWKTGTRIKLCDPEVARETVASFYEKLYQPRKIDEEIKEWQRTIDQQMIFYEKVMKIYILIANNRK